MGGGGGGTTGALPDVQISGSPSTGTPAVGAQFSYTYQIKNSGQATATAVTFTDVLPSELDPLGFRSVTVSDGSACTAPTIPDIYQVLISCDLGDMAPGAQKTVTAVVTAPLTPGTIVINTARRTRPTATRTGATVTGRSPSPRAELARVAGGPAGRLGE